MFRVVLPQLFENMEEATVGAWLVSEGQEIEAGAPLCELITEKTTLELPASQGGWVRKLAVPAKAVVPANALLALIGEQNEPLLDLDASPAPQLPTPVLEVPTLSIAASANPSAQPTANAASNRIRATPAARRAARELGVALEAVAARFPGKVVGEAEVLAFAAP